MTPIALAFVTPTIPLLRTVAPTSRRPSNHCAKRQSPSMTKKGFGKAVPPPIDPTAASKRRQAASDRYDQMAAAGMPEYTVWMRLKEGGTDNPDEQMPWLPVGSISVPRSNQVVDAIFDTEEDLMQGAIRLYPNLQKEERDNIQIGYQLRQFDDEPIRLVERQPSTGIVASLTKFFRNIQNPLNQPK